MPSRSPRRLGLLALAAGAALLAAPTYAAAAGITLDRVPAPPQAVTPGQAERINYTITFDSVPQSQTLRITGPGANINEPTSLSGRFSPVTAFRDFVVPAGSTPGRYTASLDFFSNAGGPITPEATASVIFDVAPSLGNLQVTKWEDVNGNGTLDPAEPGLPSWNFTLTNPSGDQSATATGTEGSVLLSGVPTGTWTVAEVPEPGWVAVTPANGQVIVPPNGTGTFQVGNVRPAPLSGVVWIDANRNQQIDPTEVPAGGIKLTLTGTTGTGQAVNGTTFTNPQGQYEFPGLMPGSYAVAVAKPGGYSLTTTQTISNIPITSGTPSPNHNFGIARGDVPDGRISGDPNPPELDIDKRGPASKRRNVPFNFTITVKNTSRFTARQVVLEDPVPDSMTLVTRPRGATIVNGVVTWNLGTLAAGASRRVTMRVKINPNEPAGRKRNRATVFAQGVPPESDTSIVRVTDPPPVPRSGGVTG